jgi:hypothetical protein
MPSLISIQILSTIICFFCATYLIISIFYPFSFENIINGLHFQLRQSNVDRLINTTGFTPTKTQSILILSTNLSNKSFICDYVKNDNVHNKTSPLSFDNHRLNALHRT